MQIKWKRLCEVLAEGFALNTRQTTVSNWLDAPRNDSVQEGKDDDYAAVAKLRMRINQLACMDFVKHRDDRVKIDFRQER